MKDQGFFRDGVESSWKLSAKEAELIRLVRAIKFGEITAVIKSGNIEYVRKEETIKL